MLFAAAHMAAIGTYETSTDVRYAAAFGVMRTSPPDRSPFLVALADELRGLEPLGDGVVARTVQAGFFHPPDSAELRGAPSKYGRGP